MPVINEQEKRDADVIAEYDSKMSIRIAVLKTAAATDIPMHSVVETENGLGLNMDACSAGQTVVRCAVSRCTIKSESIVGNITADQVSQLKNQFIYLV